MSLLNRRVLVRAFALIACFEAICATGARAQTQSAALQVVAAVDMRCSVATIPVTFGDYSPTLAHVTTPLDTVGGVSLNCSQGGNNVRVALGQGLYPAPGSTARDPRPQMSNGPNRLPYFIFMDAAHTTPWFNQGRGYNPGNTYPVTVPLYGRIPAGQDVPPGVYNDVVVVTVTF